MLEIRSQEFINKSFVFLKLAIFILIVVLSSVIQFSNVSTVAGENSYYNSFWGKYLLLDNYSLSVNQALFISDNNDHQSRSE